MLLLFFLYILPFSRSITCSWCETATCAPLTNCPGNVGYDVCNCCNECLKQLGDECGGPFGALGTCDEGLQCVSQPKKAGECRSLEKHNCTSLMHPDAAVPSPCAYSNVAPGTQCQLKCHTGTLAQGNAFYTCTESGVWSGSLECIDNVKPKFRSCPDNIVAIATYAEMKIRKKKVTWSEPAAWDNSGRVTISQIGPRSGELISVGSTLTVKYTASDDDFNQAVCNFTVTVKEHRCEALTAPTNSAISANCTHHINSVCTIACLPGFTLEGSSSTHCREGSWSELGQCIPTDTLRSSTVALIFTDSSVNSSRFKKVVATALTQYYSTTPCPNNNQPTCVFISSDIEVIKNDSLSSSVVRFYVVDQQSNLVEGGQVYDGCIQEIEFISKHLGSDVLQISLVSNPSKDYKVNKKQYSNNTLIVMIIVAVGLILTLGAVAGIFILYTKKRFMSKFHERSAEPYISLHTEHELMVEEDHIVLDDRGNKAV